MLLGGGIVVGGDVVGLAVEMLACKRAGVLVCWWVRGWWVGELRLLRRISFHYAARFRGKNRY